MQIRHLFIWHSQKHLSKAQKTEISLSQHFVQGKNTTAHMHTYVHCVYTHGCTLRIHTRMYIAYIHADVHCVYTRGCTLRIYTQMASGEVPAAPSHLQALNAQIPVLFLFWAPYDLGLPFGDDLSQTAWSESQLLHLPALRLWPRSDLPHICKIFLICKIGTVR